MQSRRDLYVGAGFNTNSYKKTFLSAWFNLSADEAPAVPGEREVPGLQVAGRPRHVHVRSLRLRREP